MEPSTVRIPMIGNFKNNSACVRVRSFVSVRRLYDTVSFSYQLVHSTLHGLPSFFVILYWSLKGC